MTELTPKPLDSLLVVGKRGRYELAFVLREDTSLEELRSNIQKLKYALSYADGVELE